MKRLIMEKLLNWKNDKYRKPLIIRGARQVGKTYIVNKFGEKHYENLVYFNFDNDKELHNIFEYTKDPERILNQLRVISGKPIIKEKTLIFFDEIQECQNALNSLKYFNELENEYHIIAAGSLLGIKVGKSSFPVGKINYLDLKPMTFSEFLIANSLESYVEQMAKIKVETDIDILHERLIEQLKLYYIIGGMPEVVKAWRDNKNIELVYTLQQNILNAYKDDFAKHTTSSEANKITQIYESVPSQLGKENKKFLYQVVKEGARAREYEEALNWLVDANLLYKSYNVSKTDIPLKAYQDLSAFKIYLNDVGLLVKHSNLSGTFIKSNDFQNEFKGALTENFIFNHLVSNFDIIPNYYTFKHYEIDFLLQTEDLVIPIEVKSSENINSISLKNYTEKYKPELKIKFSTKKLKIEGNTLNIPLYMIEYVKELIRIKKGEL